MSSKRAASHAFPSPDILAENETSPYDKPDDGNTQSFPTTNVTDQSQAAYEEYYAAYYANYYAQGGSAASTWNSDPSRSFASTSSDYEVNSAASTFAYGAAVDASVQPHPLKTSNTSSDVAYTKIPGGAKKAKTVLRAAGGEIWNDTTLLNWDPGFSIMMCSSMSYSLLDDYRIFCGDLGKEVTDEMLSAAFRKYHSFLRASVIRDRRSLKTKGYGFVSFKDVNDYVKAFKEMNGFNYNH